MNARSSPLLVASLRTPEYPSTVLDLLHLKEFPAQTDFTPTRMQQVPLVTVFPVLKDTTALKLLLAA